MDMPLSAHRTLLPLSRADSIEQVEVLTTRLHGVDDQLVAIVEAQNDEFQKATRTVEAQAELAAWGVLVEVADEDRITGCVDRVLRPNSVLERRRVDLHET